MPPLFLLRMAILRALIGLVENSRHHEKHFAIRRFTSVRDHMLVDVIAERLCGFHSAEARKDGVGMLSGEAAARGEPPAWQITGRPCGPG